MVLRGIAKVLSLVMVFLLIMQPVFAGAASSARIIPTGKVSVLGEADGRELNHFKSEMPLPQGILMACSGNCLIQTQHLQLVAQDQAVFAASDGEQQWDLTVKNGRVDFAIRPEAKPIAFHTPHDVLRIEQAVIPAGGSGAVRGYISVRDKVTEVAVEEGALQVSGANGVQMIQPGHSILLAQAQMTPPQQEKKDKDKPAGYIPPSGSTSGAGAGGGGIGGISTPALVLGGAGLAGIGIGLGFALTSGGDEKPISPK